jgi:hypothetical protein
MPYLLSAAEEEDLLPSEEADGAAEEDSPALFSPDLLSPDGFSSL